MKNELTSNENAVFLSCCTLSDNGWLLHKNCCRLTKSVLISKI